MNKIIGIVLNIVIAVLVIIILFIFYNLVQTKILKKDYTNFFGFTALQISTGSMRNTLQEKDIIFVDILSEEEKEALKKDDIVVFKQGSSLIVHRIINIEEDLVITKGDANNAEDEPIQKNNIIGKMVKVVSRVGIWEKVFTTPSVYVSIIITIALFGITFYYCKKSN